MTVFNVIIRSIVDRPGVNPLYSILWYARGCFVISVDKNSVKIFLDLYLDYYQI